MRKLTLLTPLVFILLAGKCPQQQPQTSPSLSADCAETVRIFNSGLTYSVVNDLKEINSRRNGLPLELANLYPDARDKWNSAISSIESYYSKDPDRIWVASYNGPFDLWRNENLENYQKFFVLLTELRWGKYSSSSRDVLAKSGWQESTDMNRRINSKLKLLQQRCGTSANEDVRRSLKIKRLPATIYECLK